MLKQNTTQNNQWADKIFEFSKKLSILMTQPLIEVYYGIKKDTINYVFPITWGIAFDAINLLKYDRWLFNYLKVSWLFPKNPILYTIYVVVGATMGFWLWGLMQYARRNMMIERLTQVFQESGLKSAMGKLPKFIFDVPVDEFVRRLRITNAFMPKAKFVEAKAHLESALQVYIDDVLENKSSGTIDILYSHSELEKMVQMKNIKTIGPDMVMIGKSRAKDLYTNLKDTPHFLIGGQTNSGKSTFLRQLITSLYVNNPKYEFSLIDMKEGLEFQIFDKRDRVSVASNIQSVLATIEKIDKLITDRFQVLKNNSCKDIEQYSGLNAEGYKDSKGEACQKIPMNRHVIVIDEAAELFLSGKGQKFEDIQKITRYCIRIAAQGRACGVHLIVATQKPDANAVNSQIKANLMGIVSFPMATLGASMSILGNGRAKELPNIAGRAVWRSGLEQFEVQTPFLSSDAATELLDKVSPIKATVTETVEKEKDSDNPEERDVTPLVQITNAKPKDNLSL